MPRTNSKIRDIAKSCWMPISDKGVNCVIFNTCWITSSTRDIRCASGTCLSIRKKACKRKKRKNPQSQSNLKGVVGEQWWRSVRAPASHQCDTGSITRLGDICGLIWLVLFCALRGSHPGYSGFPLPSKTCICFNFNLQRCH